MKRYVIFANLYDGIIISRYDHLYDPQFTTYIRPNTPAAHKMARLLMCLTAQGKALHPARPGAHSAMWVIDVDNGKAVPASAVKL